MESFLNLFEKSFEITEGFSNDRKFKCINEDGQAYLCRFFKIKDMAKASAHYELLRQFQGVDGFQQVLYILKCNDQEHGVLVFDWVDGQPLSQIDLTFELGQQAGKIINQLHQIEIPYNKPKKGKTQFELIEQAYHQYIQSGGYFKNLDTLNEMFNKTKDQYKIERLVPLHGNLKAENFILTPNNELVLINFNHHEIGDISLDLETLIFWEDEAFVNGVLSQVDLNDQILMNIKILLYASPRHILCAAESPESIFIDKIVDKNRNIIQKLTRIQKISKL